MRPEEIFSIRVEYLHLAKRYLFVPNGKTRFAKRNIPLTEAAICVLLRRTAAANGHYLFANRKDANRRMITVQKCHEAALRMAEISPAFRLYDLRHTFDPARRWRGWTSQL